MKHPVYEMKPHLMIARINLVTKRRMKKSLRLRKLKTEPVNLMRWVLLVFYKPGFGNRQKFLQLAVASDYVKIGLAANTDC